MKSIIALAISWMLIMAMTGPATGTAVKGQSIRSLSDSVSAKRNFIRARIHYQIAAGLSSTNLLVYSSGLPYSYDRSQFVRIDLFGVKNLSRRVDVRLGIAYEPIGYTDVFQVDVNDLAVTKTRLFYGNVHAVVGYQPFRISEKINVHLLGGLFVGRLFNDDIISRLSPGGQVFVNKSFMTYNGWNAGASLGVSGAIQLNDVNAVGLKMMYQPGLLNTVTKEATAFSGIRRYTTSINLSAFYQF